LDGELKEPKEHKELEKPEAEGGKPAEAELVEPAAKELRDKVSQLEAEVAARTQEISELKKLNELNELNFEGAKAAYAYAVEDYKKLVLQSNPLFTDDIIGGSNIDELKASMEKAKMLVDNIKTRMKASSESEAESSRVPAGAPARSGLDTAAMSAKEKINFGLEQARKHKD